MAHLQQPASDDALDILDGLIDAILRDAIKTRRKERLRTLGDLDAAALTLADTNAELLTHTEWTGEQIKGFLDQRRSLLEGAVDRVHALARPEERGTVSRIAGALRNDQTLLATSLQND
jgi:hypothetical protein